MAFKIGAKRTVSWPVTVSIPQDGGRTTKQTFTAEFEMKTVDELEAINARGEVVLDHVIVGWKGVQDEDGNEMPYTDENRAKLIGIPYLRAAFFLAYGELQQGREAARKN